MAKKLTVYDPAEDLDSADAIALFLSEAFRTEDAGYIAHALGAVGVELAAAPPTPRATKPRRQVKRAA